MGSTPGSATSATVFVPCDNAVLISYRLNEPADAGVIVEIHSEATVVRAFTNAPGSPGALRGANTLIWNVRNEQGEFVPFGFYTVQITAAGNGHGDWTQISDDFNAGVFQPRGIAVNRNANSPYYGRVFVAMELVEGRRLSETLSGRNTLDVDAALRLVLDLGAAVETLHNMGAVHGALRPRNVMVLEDGRVKLMDVELAGLRDAPAMESIFAAESPAEYLSPEQIRRAPVTEKTDIYAFGVVLYEMLCGVPPFQAPTREAILTKHLTETLVPVRRRRRGVPASVESAVALALYKQPELRPLMQDVLNRLWAEANGPATRWKRPAAIAAGAALAASVVMLVAWVLFAQHVPAPRPLAQPAEQAPVSALPRSSAPPTEPGTAPVVGPLAPAVGPATPAAVLSPAVRATPPTTAPPASRPPRAERRDQPLERPAASSDAEADDPGAIIDWLLSRSSARGR